MKNNLPKPECIRPEIFTFLTADRPIWSVCNIAYAHRQSKCARKATDVCSLALLFSIVVKSIWYRKLWEHEENTYSHLKVLLQFS